MKRLDQNTLDAFICIGQYNTDNPLTPAIPRATTLFADLATVANTMELNGSSQATGFTGFRGGSQARRFAFAAVLTEMRAMNKIAFGLDPLDFPGLREEFRMPSSRSYQNTLAQARTFVTNATGKEAIFTDRGMPTGFLTAFTALVDAAEASVHTRNTGRMNRAAATFAMTVARRRGHVVLRELDSIMRAALRDNPGLLAAWKTAKRIARRAPSEPVPAEGTSTPPSGT